MNILQTIKFAWRSIRGKRGRSVLTILSIFIGIAAVMTIVSVMEGMKEYTRKMYESMGSSKITVNIYDYNIQYDENGNQISSAKDYYSDLANFCKSIPDYVVAVTPECRLNATAVYGTVNTSTMEYKYDDDWNYISGPPSMYYGSEQYSNCNNYVIAQGRDFSYLDVANYKQVVVMGSECADIFFGKLNPIGKTIQLNGNNFEVIGVYEQTAENEAQRMASGGPDNFLVVPYTTSRVLGGASMSSYAVKGKDSSTLKETMGLISGYLKGLVNQNTGGYDIYSQSTWAQNENEYMTMIGLVLGGIAAISLLVGGIGIMNIMLVTVTERTREIGVRRAIGATRSSIVLQFLIEAGMLCGMGGIIGIMFGYIGSAVVGKIAYKMFIFPPLWVTLATFVFSVCLGLLFGSYPAVKASKLQPVEALRAE